MDSATLKRFTRLATGLLIIIGPLFLYLSNQTPLQTASAAQPAGFPALRQDTETPTHTPTHTHTPTASNTPTPSRTTTPTVPPTALYADAYEPNNNINGAYTILPNASAACNITLWPVGDEDYFKFAGKAGLTYEVKTHNLDPGIDTVLTVYNPQGVEIASNDDYEFGNRGSLVEFTANSEGFYYARIINQEPSDPTNRKYCFDVSEIQGPPTPTGIPTGTRVPGADVAEWNGSIDTAYLIGPGTTYQMNFVPLIDEGPDNDFFRIWVKAGLFYTCETLNLSSVTDTNMILYDSNGNPFNPPIGNDDKEFGNFGSRVSYFATYTGWLYILVGPHAAPEYGLSHLYTYDLRCEQLAVTPTPVATATRTPAPAPPGGGGPGPSIPTATPTVTTGPGPITTPQEFPTFPPTPTPPTPTVTPAVVILPLPTPTPSGPGQQSVSLNITLYYDANDNFTAELTEGVMDVAIALYDNATNQLLAFGYTNEAGQITFDAIVSSGPIRISVPFLNYSQLVVGVNANIFIRIPKGALPIGIP